MGRGSSLHHVAASFRTMVTAQTQNHVLRLFIITIFFIFLFKYSTAIKKYFMGSDKRLVSLHACVGVGEGMREGAWGRGLDGGAGVRGCVCVGVGGGVRDRGSRPLSL